MNRLHLMLAAVLSSGWAVVPAADAVIEPFNGKDLEGWKLRPGEDRPGRWKVGKAEADPADRRNLVATSGGSDLVNEGDHGVDLWTVATHGDARIEIEVLVPRGSNSGIYVMGEYEVQVFDSFGKEKVDATDMGAIYGIQAPRVNASKAPMEWQRYVIEFRAPRFDAEGHKTANARFLRITLNDQVIHEDLELPRLTPAGVTGTESASGPLMLQGNHGPVAYRGIRISRLAAN